LSNPAIGDLLFVSPKTVEHHLSAILGKLEVYETKRWSRPVVAAGSTTRPAPAASRATEYPSGRVLRQPFLTLASILYYGIVETDIAGV
jgi:hypothetical protein